MSSNELIDRVLRQERELERLKRHGNRLHVKPLAIAFFSGWVIAPWVIGIIGNSLLPKPVREVVTVVNAAYSDVVLGLQCRGRK